MNETIKPCPFLGQGELCRKFLDMPSKMELNSGMGFCTVAQKREEQEKCTEHPEHVWISICGSPVRGEDGRQLAEKIQALNNIGTHPQC